MTEPASRLRALLPAAALGLLGIGLGAGGVRLWEAHGGAPADRAAIEQVVHDYILAHPEVLPEAMDKLRDQDNAKTLAGVRGAVETPYPGAVLGNPQGRVTLVEFTDYACGFCRKSVPDVEALAAANPDLRVVVRELPILTPESTDAAKMALAAAAQGKYGAFHKAMFETARPDAQSIAAAAQAAGLDMARARSDIADPRIQAELERNLDLARQLGFSGTPSWVVGNKLQSGALGADELAQMVDAARS